MRYLLDKYYSQVLARKADWYDNCIINMRIYANIDLE